MKKKKDKKDNTAIVISNLSKSYRQYKNNHQRILGELFNRDTGETVEVLKDISLTVQRGENLLIIGNTGSGRSTLMHILAGQIKPDSGTIKINGKLTTYFCHKLLFDPIYTGKDTVYLRGGFMGWDREEIARRLPAIAEFAELTDVMDRPIQTYPAGAANRLGFAIETEEQPEILLFDDIVSFGSAHHIEKCIDRLKTLIDNEDTTMLHVHINPTFSKALCTRAVVLHEGSIVFDGGVDEALKYYRRHCKDRLRKKADDGMDDASMDFGDDSFGEGGMGDF